MRLVARQDEERLFLCRRHLSDRLEARVLIDADLDALVIHANEEVVDDSLRGCVSAKPRGRDAGERESTHSKEAQEPHRVHLGDETARYPRGVPPQLCLDLGPFAVPLWSLRQTQLGGPGVGHEADPLVELARREDAAHAIVRIPRVEYRLSDVVGVGSPAGACRPQRQLLGELREEAGREHPKGGPDLVAGSNRAHPGELP